MPEIRLPWWNAKTNQLEYAELPAVTLQVAAGENTGADTAPAVSMHSKSYISVTACCQDLAQIFKTFQMASTLRNFMPILEGPNYMAWAKEIIHHKLNRRTIRERMKRSTTNEHPNSSNLA